ncbi:archease [Streptomyces sp. MUM 178J]|uniref:archease n=1 Tax=Streptomyces sp. MUM 178J TaxID=2791991 RepID=UPI001F048B41|nr:archease [Streptomyces sp. MUM 178J]WRQ80409.1 archease [Streptomyces sp. MUM 178J]
MYLPPESAGRRSVPHTADLRVEAWGPTREECLEQAVHGVCESFLDLRGAQAVGRREAAVLAGSDEELLVALLEEVVYWLDAEGEVPVGVEVAPVDRGVHAVLRMADARSCPVVGASPKAVTWHGLEFGRGPAGWRCAVTVDV